MEVYRRSSWLLLLLGLSLLAATLQGVQGEVESEGPTESECRPYIEKALKELEAGEAETAAPPDDGDSKEDLPTVEITTDDSDHPEGDGDDDTDGEGKESAETEKSDDVETTESEEKEASQEQVIEGEEQESGEEGAEDKHESAEEEQQASGEEEEATESGEEAAVDEEKEESKEKEEASAEEEQKEESKEEEDKETEEVASKEEEEEEAPGEPSKEEEEGEEEGEEGSVEKEGEEASKEEEEAAAKSEEEEESKEDEQKESKEEEEEEKASKEVEEEEEKGSKEEEEEEKGSKEEEEEASKEEEKAESKEEGESKEDVKEEAGDEESKEAKEGSKEEEEEEEKEEGEKAASEETSKEDEKEEESKEKEEGEEEEEETPEGVAEVEELIKESEEDLTELRPRDHIAQLLKLDEESSETEKITHKFSEIILRELKKLYENAIKPLETLYKYRDLSNRHFGDAEIFSKPLILFMGPWSGGKSTIINYLLGIEHNETTLHTGAEPSPAYFNILMYGDEPEVLDGTVLAADYTFSGLQKFGQGLEERLRGYKLPSKLLEKVNIVEIPGILEVRKQVSRVFPFNDACQWFIDRADIIFLVYDPSKLDVGPETEAILDQLKGREHQTRIVLNKADQVKPEELMRVQGALIWNISPLMSSAQPPMMYTTSLWSKPYEPWAPVKLLQAQERAFLRDLRSAVDKRNDNKIASARRFAVRVRNHAKMVDCYLTTYYNHKSVFGNRKQISDEIINHPQDYHIYEGLSTLTNISRYDLPDPDVYRDFFRLNALYDFQQLSSTCTYFRGCPINRLDVAIAYDLPELVGKHKRLVETAINEANSTPTPGS
ncbi:hypothetical protein ILUMI_20563 [Ignelater luminosus]|uniref:Dynamin-type G domain-containing protein n=1 Tax=Ignelater luminosus TaxID=2038154 RepID=A0A8K0CH89_IGNLU|nr:hypothetical protein ILUMI_20563 [Ignelater luminosus]